MFKPSITHLRMEELVPTTALHSTVNEQDWRNSIYVFFRVKLLSTHIMPDILVAMKIFWSWGELSDIDRGTCPTDH